MSVYRTLSLIFLRPVVGQLKSHLDEGVRTDSTLLDLSLAEISERYHVEVDVVG